MTSPQLTSYPTNENHCFFSNIRTKTRMSTVTAFLQYSTVSSSQSSYARNKRHSNSKGSSKTITTILLLQYTKISTQNVVAFLYTNKL